MEERAGERKLFDKLKSVGLLVKFKNYEEFEKRLDVRVEENKESKT